MKPESFDLGEKRFRWRLLAFSYIHERYFNEVSESKHIKKLIFREDVNTILMKADKQRVARLCEGGVINGYVEYIYEHCYQ